MQTCKPYSWVCKMGQGEWSRLYCVLQINTIYSDTLYYSIWPQIDDCQYSDNRSLSYWYYYLVMYMSLFASYCYWLFLICFSLSSFMFRYFYFYCMYMQHLCSGNVALPCHLSVVSRWAECTAARPCFLCFASRFLDQPIAIAPQPATHVAFGLLDDNKSQRIGSL